MQQHLMASHVLPYTLKPTLGWAGVAAWHTHSCNCSMVGRLLEPGPVAVAWADVEDDRRSTSTVASTAGTGFISLAHRMAALAVDFSDKLGEDGEPERAGGAGLSEGRSARLHSLHQRRVDEEDDEDDGTRSERTVNTAVTGDDGEPAAEQEEPMGAGRRRSSLLGGGIDTPDHQYALRLPFQVSSMRLVEGGACLSACRHADGEHGPPCACRYAAGCSWPRATCSSSASLSARCAE